MGRLFPRFFSRLFSSLLLTALLLHVPARMQDVQGVQPVFFSMLFPQLIPVWLSEAPAGEAVSL